VNLSKLNLRRKRNVSDRQRRISSPIGELSSATPPTTDAGRFLCQRHHVDPQIADLLAQLAGLGLDEVLR
jgi:hypothetical protein